MKKRNMKVAAAIFCALATAVAGFLWWAETINQQTSSETAPTKGNPIVRKVAGRLESIKMFEAAGKANEQEIAFYGRVIDQDSNPVDGATVMGVAQYNNMIKEGMRSYETLSDIKGDFTFPRIQGKSFECNLRKNGYLYSNAQKGGYIISHLAPVAERFVPNQSKPEIFRMWKLQGAEVLLSDGAAFYLPSDGVPIYVDLKSGKQSNETGDIAFWCRHVVLPEDTPFEQRSVDWTFGIKVAGGGVIPTSSGMPYGAPSDGYEETWEYHLDKGQSRQGIDGKTFYFKTGNREYGAIYIDVLNQPDRFECPVGIGWKINPSGSRNLEPGKEKPVKQKSSAKPGMTLQYLRQNRG